MLKAARAKGVFVIHAPSTCTGFTRTPRNESGRHDAPFATTPETADPNGALGNLLGYCRTRKREGVLPIDDSDMGCDCERNARFAPVDPTDGCDRTGRCERSRDNGQETWNLFVITRLKT